MRTFTLFLGHLAAASLLAVTVVGVPDTSFDPTKPVPWSTSGESDSSADLAPNAPATPVPQSL